GPTNVLGRLLAPGGPKWGRVRIGRVGTVPPGRLQFSLTFVPISETFVSEFAGAGEDRNRSTPHAPHCSRTPPGAARRRRSRQWPAAKALLVAVGDAPAIEV